jgi:tRNA pseudouridine13 synthase
MAIRREPADFRVEELLSDGFTRGLVLTPSASDPACFAVYRLHKSSLTTEEACNRLAHALGVPTGLIAYAGLKDKHAQTSQAVSIPADARADWPERLEGPQWSAERVGFATAACSAAVIAANRFTLVVRGLDRVASQRMYERDRLITLRTPAPLATPPAAQPHTPPTEHAPPTAAEVAQPAAPRPTHPRVFINYFGSQRFGSARHGRGFAGRRLAAGDFEGALQLLIGTPARKDTGDRRVFTRLAARHWGEWSLLARRLPAGPLRGPIEALAVGESAASAFTRLPALTQQMAVEAFQSHLWNQTARGMVLALGHADELLRAPDRFGELLFPPADRLPSAWHGLQMPMLARGVKLDGPWADAAAAALAAEGVTLDDLAVPNLRRPAFRPSLRPLLARAERFSLSRAEREPTNPDRSTRTVRFDLPRGAYATVLLRALGQ